MWGIPWSNQENERGKQMREFLEDLWLMFYALVINVFMRLVHTWSWSSFWIGVIIGVFLELLMVVI
jgi:hypothetical protein